MKVTTKLSAAFGLLVVVLAALLVYHVRTNRAVVVANHELAEISSRLQLTSSRQIAALNQLEETAGKFWVTRDTGYLALFDRAFRDFDRGLDELTANAQTEQEREAIDALAAAWSEFLPIAAQVNRDALVTDPPARMLEQLLASLRFQIRRVVDASQAAIRDRLEASASASRQAERVSWMVGAATLLLTLLIATLIVRSTSNGLQRLQRGTQQVSLGNFEYRLPDEGGDEFAQLARDFNVMIRRLGELDRMKRDFLSKVSHDLKTPLASMHETVQVMLDGVPGPLTARQRRLLDLTQDSAARLSSMITKILDLSAIEAGALTLEVRPTPLQSLVQPAVDTIQLADPARATQVQVRLPRQPVLVECDRDRIVQVLVNLLENAIKFSPEGAPVGVAAHLLTAEQAESLCAAHPRVGTAATPAPAVLIEVSDRGPGVPDADKRRIFEHFFQSSQPGGHRRGGVGLGLAICREIVDLHGGSIWVRDNPEGGSTFVVLLQRVHVRTPDETPSFLELEASAV